ncbi:MAG: glutaredoxin family protein [Nitrosomonadales bacterium]|nr:glutaredoxin family protein [Nitrosomonadales bacterium]
MTQLVLYGKDSCHLCDDAEVILRGIAVEYDYADITTDPELQEKYAIRIPVLKRQDTGAELGWPFDAEALRRFLTVE